MVRPLATLAVSRPLSGSSRPILALAVRNPNHTPQCRPVRRGQVVPPPPFPNHPICARRGPLLSGPIALLCAGIDGDRIRLIGRWKSDEMYLYLHVQAQPVMSVVAAEMFRSGHHRILPGSTFSTLPAGPLTALPTPHPSFLSASWTGIYNTWLSVFYSGWLGSGS